MAAETPAAGRAARDDEPFVGRATELKTARELIGDLEKGRPFCLLVEGEAGAGKTRLLHRVLETVEPARLGVVTAGAGEFDRDLPFSLFRDLLRSRPDAPVSGGPAPIDADSTHGPGARLEQIEAIVDDLEALSLRLPQIAALEDLHWADSASLATLGRLVSKLESVPLGLLLTFRSHPRPQELIHLVAMAEDRGAQRMHLPPLQREEIIDLARLILREEPGSKLVRSLESCGGNALLVRELLASAEEEGPAWANGARTDAPAMDLSGSVLAIARRRLDDLSEGCRDLMRLASVLGTAFSVDDLSAWTRRSAADLMPLLDEAIRAGILTSFAEHMGFRHELLRQGVYEDIALPLRRSLHLEAAEALAATGGSAGRIATHTALGSPSGDPVAISWLRKGAREVAEQDPAAGVWLLDRALELVDQGDPSRYEIVLELARLLLWSAAFGRCIDVLEDLLADEVDPDTEWIARGLLSRALIFAGREGEVIEQMEVLERAGTLTEHRQVILIAARAQALSYANRFREAFDESLTAKDAAYRAGLPEGVSLACLTAALVCYLEGRYDEGIRYGREGLEQTKRARWDLELAPFGPPAGHQELGASLLEADRPDEAMEVVRDGIEELRRSGRAYLIPPSHFIAAMAAYVSGAWDEALAEVESGLRTSLELDDRWTDPMGLTIAVVVGVRRADADAVRTNLASMEEAFIRRPQPGFSVPLSLWAASAHAELVGDESRACDLIRDAAHGVMASDLLGLYRMLALDHVRLHFEAQRLEEARRGVGWIEEAARRVPGVPSLRAAGLYAQGLVAEDAGVLLEAVERYRDVPRPLERARACAAACEVLFPQGRSEEGRALLDESLELFESLGATFESRRLHARLRPLGIRLGAKGRRGRPRFGWDALTPAEERVVSLVCEGLTNADIAKRLFVSPRTVDSHMTHVLRKVQVASRTELVAEAISRGVKN